MKDPKYRELKRSEIRSRLEESGPEVANELGLTTSQLRQLIDLETEFQMHILETFIPGGPGHPPDHAAAQASVAKQQELRGKLDADIVALLGAEKAQQLKAYVKSEPARREVKQFQTSLMAAEIPMTVAQQKSLVATIAAEQERRNNAISSYQAREKNAPGGRKTIFEYVSGELDINEQESARIVQAATTILNPSQLSSLQKMLSDNDARNRLHLQAHTSNP